MSKATDTVANAEVIKHNRVLDHYFDFANKMEAFAKEVDSIDTVSGAYARGLVKRIRAEAEAFSEVSAITLKG